MKIPNLLQKRAALTDACGALLDLASKESRSLTADERREFDAHAAELRDLKLELARERALCAPDPI